jgi:DNA-binding MarR family transcriptional regulator
MSERDLADADYQLLLRFRTDLRRFLHWSDEQAQAEGLTAAQHQLLLAIRGHPGPGAPTVSNVADALLLRHHSATGLVDRAVLAGWVKRTRDRDDHRAVRLSITRSGAAKLARLSRRHLQELERLQHGIFG